MSSTTVVRAFRALLGASVVTALAACSLVGTEPKPEGSKDVVLVTHDSFVLPKRLIQTFEARTGYHLVVHAAGDGGTLTNKLVLTKDDPTGDVAFGVDNTFASRALDAGVFADYTPSDLPAGAALFDLPAHAAQTPTPAAPPHACAPPPPPPFPP